MSGKRRRLDYEWAPQPADYIQLSPARINHLLKTYDTDTSVKIGMGLKLGDLLSGGIHVSHPHVKSLARNNFEPDYYNERCQQLTQRYVRSDTAIGFAGVVIMPDAQYGSKACVLDPKQCSVWYHKTCADEWFFRWFENPDTRSTRFGSVSGTGDRTTTPASHVLGVDGMYGIEIPNVITIVSKPPDADGTIHSLLTELEEDANIEDSKSLCMMVAETRNCMPPVLIQPQAVHNDQYNARSALSFEGTGQPSTSIDHGEANDDHTQLNAMMEAQDQNLMRLGAMPAPDSGSQNSRKIRHRESVRQVYSQPQMIPLPPGATGFNTQLSTPPQDYLEFRQARMDRVLQLLGVPPSLITTHSALATKGKEGGHQFAYQLFIKNQQALKNTIIRFLKRTMIAMHGRQWLQSYQRAIQKYNDAINKQDEKDGEESADDDIEQPMKGKQKQRHKAFNKWEASKILTSIQIDIPGIPNLETMDALLLKGALKYEAYVKCYAAQTGLSEACFEPKQKLTIKELNGIKPEAPKAPTGATPSTSKPKTNNKKPAQDKRKTADDKG